MIKKLLSLAVVSIFLFALTVSASTLALIPKVGLNLASVSEDPETDLEATYGEGTEKGSRMGMTIGAGLEVGLGGFAIETGLYYSQKGEKYSNDDAKATVTTKLDYLTIPALFKYILGMDSLNLFFVAGPELGLLMKAEGETDVDGDVTTVDYKDYTESMDLGLTIGAGVEISSIVVEGKYTLGLMDTSKLPDDAPEGTEDDYKTKNNVISVALGYKIGF